MNRRGFLGAFAALLAAPSLGKVAQLSQKNFTIITTPKPNEPMRMGFKGSSYLEAGAVYAPYVPLQWTSLRG